MFDGIIWYIKKDNNKIIKTINIFFFIYIAFVFF
jgi:hypothetical protein